jgi:HEAT repeat protein
MKKSLRRPVTAITFMNELNEDPDFIRRKEIRDAHFDSVRVQLERAEKPLVEALNDVVGISVKSVSDLVNTSLPYYQAVPVLVCHLKYQYPYPVREAIARALTVKDAGAAAYEALVREFKKQADSADAAQMAFKWALGNAISVVADKTDFDEVVELVRDKRNSMSRDMMVLRLPKLDPRGAVKVLIELLDDDKVAGHAAMALGELRAQEARAKIEGLTKHGEAWIRKEAKKALAKLNKT